MLFISDYIDAPKLASSEAAMLTMLHTDYIRMVQQAVIDNTVPHPFFGPIVNHAVLDLKPDASDGTRDPITAGAMNCLQIGHGVSRVDGGNPEKGGRPGWGQFLGYWEEVPQDEISKWPPKEIHYRHRLIQIGFEQAMRMVQDGSLPSGLVLGREPQDIYNYLVTTPAADFSVGKAVTIGNDTVIGAGSVSKLHNGGLVKYLTDESAPLEMVGSREIRARIAREITEFKRRNGFTTDTPDIALQEITMQQFWSVAPGFRIPASKLIIGDLFLALLKDTRKELIERGELKKGQDLPIFLYTEKGSVAERSTTRRPNLAIDTLLGMAGRTIDMGFRVITGFKGFDKTFSVAASTLNQLENAIETLYKGAQLAYGYKNFAGKRKSPIPPRRHPPQEPQAEPVPFSFHIK